MRFVTAGRARGADAQNLAGTQLSAEALFVLMGNLIAANELPYRTEGDPHPSPPKPFVLKPRLASRGFCFG